MKIKTKQLTIRNLQAENWKEMQAIFEDFAASPYAVYDAPLPTEEEAVKDLTKKFADSKLFFGVWRADAMVGYVCFHKVGSRYDLGYCFHSAYHGNGYAYESVRALLEYFVMEKGAAGFTAGTALANAPSCALLEKLGFVCKGTETVSFDPSYSFEGGQFVLEI